MQNFGLKMGLYDFASPPAGRAGVQNVRVEFVKLDIAFCIWEKIIVSTVFSKSTEVSAGVIGFCNSYR